MEDNLDEQLKFQQKSASRRRLAQRSSLKSIVTTRLPKFLITNDTHQLLKSSINENKILNNFLSKSDTQINDRFVKLQTDITNLITSAGFNYNYCITGSRVWYETFKNIFPNLSEYEQSAIYKYNSCDSIYLIEANNIKKIDKNINDLIQEFVDYLEVVLQPNGKYFTIELKPIGQTKYLFRSATGYYIELKLSDTPIIKPVSAVSAVPLPKPPPKVVAKPAATTATPKSRSVKTTAQDKKKAEADRLAKEAEALKKKKDEATAARAARVASRRTATGGTGTAIQSQDKENIYRIFSFEFNLCNSKDEIKLLTNFDNLIVPTTHYLNEYGLYIFNIIAKGRFFIKRGLYNRFKIREDIFNKLILTSVDIKTKAFADILNIYILTFNDLRLPNQYTYNLLVKQLYLSYPDIEEFVNKVETKIIECLRPYINQTIININREFKELQFTDNFGNIESGNKLTGIFVAGGDAIRRYKYDASVTKDIDTKIYLSTEIPLEMYDNKKILDDCIINNLLILLIFLTKNKREIFRPINNPENIKLRSKSGILVEFSLYSIDDEDLDFKLRKLFKGNFPVDLYSLDYKATLMCNDKKDNLPYEIAFLDIAFEQVAENYYKKYAVISNGLPISRMKFILDDLKKTYNSDLSSILRFQGGKIVKDFGRYKELYEIYVKHEQLERESLYYTRKETDETTKKIMRDSDSIITYISPEQQRMNAQLDRAIYIDKASIERDRLYGIFKKEYDKRNIKNTTKISFDYELSKNMRKQGGGFGNIDPQIINAYNKYGYINININNDDYIIPSDIASSNNQNYLDKIIQPPPNAIINPSELIRLRNFIKKFKLIKAHKK
jgi:hypothetical protein